MKHPYKTKDEQIDIIRSSDAVQVLRKYSGSVRFSDIFSISQDDLVQSILSRGFPDYIKTCGNCDGLHVRHVSGLYSVFEMERGDVYKLSDGCDFKGAAEIVSEMRFKGLSSWLDGVYRSRKNKSCE